MDMTRQNWQMIKSMCENVAKKQIAPFNPFQESIQ